MEWRTFHLHQMIDGNGFRIGIEIGQLSDQAGAGMARFTHADDTAAAYIDSRTTDFLQSVQPILITDGS